ncbi:cytochrome bd-I oxidase subunit CydX [Budvicia aquatica]|uniref:Cytochrome bd-I oxidase subunit CydX n=1 Tax=Budvicia aquatica TaxID=82979 RepID=A0A2C6CUD8_9GAMM|nr:cytochrome bd-I oxidase subunit CydX [Budvicia aquatica]PHI30269.1 cytochrome bd-I oxidase subunit CydX [Budvicia aquatica]VFS49339.1 Predicted outer membrane lipoprotein [Budvicia aquatica]
MWYFAWSLGTLLACAAGIIGAVWYETNNGDKD